jgi:hypothetical protein
LYQTDTFLKREGIIMDLLNNFSSSTSLQDGVKKLLKIGHAAACLCCQIQEVTNVFAEVVTPDPESDPTEKVIIEDLGIMEKLTTVELLELSNLETTRQALMKSWRYVESRKTGIIQQARTRIADAGEVGQ